MSDHTASEMTAPGEVHGHGHAPTPATNPFTDAEWDQLRSEDYAAGKAVVILMLSIFTMGVFLYAAVALTVRAGIGFLS